MRMTSGFCRCGKISPRAPSPLPNGISTEGILDLRAEPPPGVFYNRMSASSHTRNHRYAPELTGAVLAWLKRHGAVVVNGERALQARLSKVAQYEALGKSASRPRKLWRWSARKISRTLRGASAIR